MEDHSNTYIVTPVNIWKSIGSGIRDNQIACAPNPLSITSLINHKTRAQRSFSLPKLSFSPFVAD